MFILQYLIILYILLVSFQLFFNRKKNYTKKIKSFRIWYFLSFIISILTICVLTMNTLNEHKLGIQETKNIWFNKNQEIEKLNQIKNEEIVMNIVTTFFLFLYIFLIGFIPIKFLRVFEKREINEKKLIEERRAKEEKMILDRRAREKRLIQEKRDEDKRLLEKRRLEERQRLEKEKITNSIKSSSDKINKSQPDSYALDKFDFNAIRPSKFKKNKNPSFTPDAAIQAGLLIKKLNIELESELLEYPVDGIIGLPFIEKFSDHFDKDNLIQTTQYSDFTQGVMGSVFRYYYNGNLSDYQQFRFAGYTCAFLEIDGIKSIFTSYLTLERLTVKTFITNDKKNKNEIFYKKGMIWGIKYIERSL
jgi:hypothetical protein